MTVQLPAGVTTLLRRAVGADPVQTVARSGGDIATAREVAFADGTRLFVKLHADGARMFPAEARGLQWLADANALRIPRVVAVGTPAAPFLALELIEPGPPAADHDEQLGRGLAALHRYEPAGFGLDEPNFVGALPQANDPLPDWPAFYRERRLRPLIRRAADAGHLDPATLRALTQLLSSLEQRCGPPEPPARLHGDLWAGNAIVDQAGAPVLIDPAVYGGHREIDLAMMRLFGGFSARCFDAYAEAYPLAPGSRDRIPLYTLYPLLVHVNLFGGAYVGQLRATLRQAI